MSILKHNYQIYRISKNHFIYQASKVYYYELKHKLGLLTLLDLKYKRTMCALLLCDDSHT